MKTKKEQTVLTTQVGIVGGGLAGVYAAYQLQQQNISYTLFEANSALGGRISGQVSPGSPTHTHDLGPTWIFEHQHKAKALALKLGLRLFEQYSQGDVLYQLVGNHQAKRMTGQEAMTMHRVEGGTIQMINALAASINAQNIHLSSCVNDIKKVNINKLDEHWLVSTKNGFSLQCKQLMLAIPPRILAQTFAEQEPVKPAQDIPYWLNPKLQQLLLSTPTWMAAQAKFLAIYDKPFWRDKGLSGQCFSQVGPMVEMHDASSTSHSFEQKGGYALFGFIGLPASHRSQFSDIQIKEACLEQLHYFYGDEVYQHQGVFLKDWSQASFICTKQDIQQTPQHPWFEMDSVKQYIDDLQLHLIASEYAQHEAGYIEGAINAVDVALANLSNKRLQ